MATRRILLAIFVAAVAVIGVRTARPADPSTSEQSNTALLDDNRTDVANAPAVSRSLPATSVLAGTATALLEPVSTIATSTPAAAMPGEELADLVDAARPLLAAIEVVDDGHHHPTHGEADSSVGATAATVVVTAWTWRWDDSAGRVRVRLENWADIAVIAQLAPTPQAETERAAAGEVSWVIIRSITVDGSIATVAFDQHLVTSTNAETITARSADVTVVYGRASEVNW